MSQRARSTQAMVCTFLEPVLPCSGPFKKRKANEPMPRPPRVSGIVERQPVSLREIPWSWWDSVLDGRVWWIDLETFPCQTTPEKLRTFIYRRASQRRLYPCTSHNKAAGRLYFQVFSFDPGTYGVGTSTEALEAPPLPRIIGNPVAGVPAVPARDLMTATYEDMQTGTPSRAYRGNAEPEKVISGPMYFGMPPEAILTLMANGWRLGPGLPQPVTAQQRAAEEKKKADEEMWRLLQEAGFDRRHDAPATPEELRIVTTRNPAAQRKLCSCGTSDFRFHEDNCALIQAEAPQLARSDATMVKDAVRQEDEEMSPEERFELDLLRARCTCNTKDFRYHPPSCGAWG